MTNKLSKVIIQEIINKFLDPSHQIQEGEKGELFWNDIEYGNIIKFKSIKTLRVLNAYVDQAALDLFVSLLDFYKLLVEELFSRIGEIVLGTDMVGQNAYYLLQRLIWD